MPEIASRRHLELVSPVIREALDAAGASLDDLDTVAVTAGPGLIGALLVGLSARRGSRGGAGCRSCRSTTCTAMSPRSTSAARARAAVHLPARKRRAHAAPRRAGPELGGRERARDDARRRRRRGLRQGREPARAPVSRAAPRSTGSPAKAIPRRYRFPVAKGARARLLLLGAEDRAPLRRPRPSTGRARAAPRRSRRELPARDRPRARRADRSGRRRPDRDRRRRRSELELRAALPEAVAAPLCLCTDNAAMIASAARYTGRPSRPTSTLRSMRLLRRPEFRLVTRRRDRRRRVADRSLVTGAGCARRRCRPPAPRRGTGSSARRRPAVTLTGREIVVLRTPSVAQRLAQRKARRPSRPSAAGPPRPMPRSSRC